MCEEMLLKINEVSRRLGFGRSFVYQRFIQSGLLPSIKVGGARRVLRSDLEQFVARLKEQSDDER